MNIYFTLSMRNFHPDVRKHVRFMYICDFHTSTMSAELSTVWRTLLRNFESRLKKKNINYVPRSVDTSVSVAHALKPSVKCNFKNVSVKNSQSSQQLSAINFQLPATYCEESNNNSRPDKLLHFDVCMVNCVVHLLKFIFHSLKFCS